MSARQGNLVQRLTKPLAGGRAARLPAEQKNCMHTPLNTKRSQGSPTWCRTRTHCSFHAAGTTGCIHAIFQQSTGTSPWLHRQCEDITHSQVPDCTMPGSGPVQSDNAHQYNGPGPHCHNAWQCLACYKAQPLLLPPKLPAWSGRTLNTHFGGQQG